MTIGPPRLWQTVNLAEIWRFRNLLVTFAERDVKLRYRQTYLGVLWVLLQPLLSAGIFSFVFGKVARLPTDGIPYFIFAYAGILGWHTFSDTVVRASMSLINSSDLITKVYFPRLILPFSAGFAVLIDFSVALVMMLILLPVFGVPLHLGILLVPLWLTLILMLAMGVGLLAGAVTVSYRDAKVLLPVVIQFLMYASPVAYSLAVVPERWRGWYCLNPLVGLLEAFRWSLLGHGELHVELVVYSGVVTVLVFACGTAAFKRLETWFADVI